MERRLRRDRNGEKMTDNRRLTRSRNKMIAGVCAGIAEYFGWEVTLFRVAYVLASILSVAFPGILVYIVLWVVMPRPD
jgi:phage shock protein PspC (stress-responsive transcriptional regulator)